MAEIIDTTNTENGLTHTPKPLLEDMLIPVKQLDKLGRAVEYFVPMPSSPLYKDWSFFQKIAMLKAGPMEKISIPMIAIALMQAEDHNLNVFEGDVYSTGEGRLAYSNKAKIKMALRTGRITGYTCEMKDAPPVESYPFDHDIECTITLNVKGFDKPIVKTQRASEWYMERNPNWNTRPTYMLELNTFAHACEMVNPTDSTDEFGDTVEPNDDLSAKLRASITAVERENLMGVGINTL